MIANWIERLTRRTDVPRFRAQACDDVSGPHETVRRILPPLALKSKRGVTAVEYARIAALIAVVIITAVALARSNQALFFNLIAGYSGYAPD